MDKLRREMIEKYTVLAERPGSYTVSLKVGHQAFTVAPQPYETRKEAEWMQEMLGLALANIVKENRHGE